LLQIYYWGAGLAVTGRTRDIGQNVLQFSFQSGNSRSPSYPIFCSLSRSSTITYIILIFIIDNNNAVINNNNNMWKTLKTFFCSSKFPWARGLISSTFIDNSGPGPQQCSPALIKKVRDTTLLLLWNGVT